MVVFCHLWFVCLEVIKLLYEAKKKETDCVASIRGVKDEKDYNFDEGSSASYICPRLIPKII